jgi:glycosyltransferase involved in cell wall biosynthesis
MNNLPLISVIVPVFKVEAYLDRCLESLTGQTYENLEILLVEDGSPDNSGAICDAWAEKDSRIRVIHQKNSGGGPARNAALDVARGELLAFVDSDDYIAPFMFRHLYDLMAEGADIAECDYRITAGDDMLFAETDWVSAAYTPEEAMTCHIRDTVFRQLIWNKLYRRELAEGVRFPSGTSIDDEYFTYRLLGNAKKLVRSNLVCYAYRQQEGSVMHRKFSLKRVESLEAKLNRIAYLEERMPALTGEAKEDLVMACLFLMQSSLQFLSGEELRKAKQLISGAMEAARPVPAREDRPRKRAILLWLAQRDLEAASRFLNMLIRLHVLH